MPVHFREALRSGRRILFDGGMGSELAVRGVAPTAAANVTAPDAVLAVHRAYREAGADVLITNTFGANPVALARSGDADQLERYVAEACRLAREALGAEGYIVGDIGPTGEFLQPHGSLTPGRMRQAFERAAGELAANGVDFLLVETLSDLNELRLALEACRSTAPTLPVAVTMAFDPARDGYRTSMGVAAADAARAMAETGADVIGANCGSITPTQMAAVVRAFRTITPLPILAQSNAGKPELAHGTVAYPLSPEAFAAASREIIRAGAQLVGGCCGAGPEHIRALRRAMDDVRKETGN